MPRKAGPLLSRGRSGWPLRLLPPYLRPLRLPPTLLCHLPAGARLLACFLTSPALPALPCPEQHLSLPLSSRAQPGVVLSSQGGRELGPCLFTAVPGLLASAPGACAIESPSPGSGHSRPQDSASVRSSQHTWDFEESDFRTSSMPSLKSHSPWIVTQDSSGAPGSFPQ